MKNILFTVLFLIPIIGYSLGDEMPIDTPGIEIIDTAGVVFSGDSISVKPDTAFWQRRIYYHVKVNGDTITYHEARLIEWVSGSKTVRVTSGVHRAPIVKTFLRGFRDGYNAQLQDLNGRKSKVLALKQQINAIINAI